MSYVISEVDGALSFEQKHHLGKKFTVIEFINDDNEVQTLITDSPQLAKLAHAFIDKDIPFRTYSGRGYFGKYTLAACTSHDVSKSQIYAAFAKAKAGEPMEDSMGLNRVLYSSTRADIKSLDELLSN